jgi:hypothetical protein
MLVLKYLLVILGIGLFGSSGALVVYDIYLSSQLRRLLGRRRSDASGELPEASAEPDTREQVYTAAASRVANSQGSAATTSQRRFEQRVALAAPQLKALRCMSSE